MVRDFFSDHVYINKKVIQYLFHMKKDINDFKIKINNFRY